MSSSTGWAGAHLAGAAGAGATAQATLLGFHEAFAAAMVFGILGFCFALRIRDQDAAASMQAAPTTPATVPAAAARAGRSVAAA